MLLKRQAVRITLEALGTALAVTAVAVAIAVWRTR